MKFWIYGTMNEKARVSYGPFQSEDKAISALKRIKEEIKDQGDIPLDFIISAKRKKGLTAV